MDLLERRREKMKATIERTMEHATAIFEAVKVEECFEEKMLKNQITGVLPFQVEEKDGIRSYCYDITNKQTLEEYLELHELSGDLIRRFLTQIISTLIHAKNFLLDADDFLLDAKYIFVLGNGESFFMCYYPGYHNPIQGQWTELFEQWMKQMDYEREEVVRLVYDLYRVSRLDTCTYEQLLAVVGHEKEKTVENFANQDQEIAKEQMLPQNDRIVAMMEKLDQESEVLRYPLWCYLMFGGELIMSGGLMAVLLPTSILRDSFHQVSPMKLCLMFCFWVVVEVFFFFEIFRENHKVSKTVVSKDYISIHENDMVQMKQIENELQQTTKRSYDGYRKGDNEIGMDDHPTEVIYEEPKTELLNPQRKLTLVPLQEGKDTIVIPQCPVVIGSSKKRANIVLPFTTISREHAKVTCENADYYVEDLDSTNGTLVNGMKIASGERIRLSVQDILQFAEYQYKVEQ